VGITFSRLSLSYWIDNLGFITEGKLAAIFIKTFSWGFPTGRSFILHQLGPISKPIPRSSTIEVHSLQRFDNRDIPYSKPPAQCLDEFDNFIVKQDNFNKRVQNHLLENSRAINKLQDIVERTSNDVKMLVKHF
jgi:hypothetical protein